MIRLFKLCPPELWDEPLELRLPEEEDFAGVEGFLVAEDFPVEELLLPPHSVRGFCA